MTSRTMTREQFRTAYRMARRMTDWRAFVQHAPRRFGKALTAGEASAIWGAKRWAASCAAWPSLYGDTLVLARTSRAFELNARHGLKG